MRFRIHRSGRWLAPGTAVISAVLLLAGWNIGRSQQVGGDSKVKGQGQARPPAAGPARGESRLPPLEVDEAEPLRLEAPAKPEAAATGAKHAENGACFVCHANFRKEELASSHAANGVGCTSCHGPSLAHRNDEANIIPPDRMFPADQLDAGCARCHDSHDVEPREVVARFLAKSQGKPVVEELTCTRCHGEHRLAVRTVRWDKKTGKLVSRAR